MVNEQRRVRAEARVATRYAVHYLRMLCKHFRHQAPTTYDQRSARIEFAAGTCELDATTPQILDIRVIARSVEALADVSDIVARQLRRFASDETLLIDWRVATGARRSNTAPQ